MSSILTERDGAVGTITIARRERYNSLDVETARELRKASLGFARDDSVRAVVLEGSGGVFSSGADLRYIRDGGRPQDLDYLKESRDGSRPTFGELFKEILEYLHSTISEIRRAPKPVIAAVDGIAAAGGFGLAMACDLVIASERASFEWAYPKTGLTGAESSTFFLPRLVGLRRALDLVLLNPRLDADAAFRAGLVSRVLPTAGFAEEVASLAAGLARGPTEAYATAKELMNLATGTERLDTHLDLELDQLVRAADSPAFADAIERFFSRGGDPSGDGG